MLSRMVVPSRPQAGWENVWWWTSLDGIFQLRHDISSPKSLTNSFLVPSGIFLSYIVADVIYHVPTVNLIVHRCGRDYHVPTVNFIVHRCGRDYHVPTAPCYLGQKIHG